MSWMHNNMWVFFVPIMIIMKIKCTIPGKTILLEFALFIKFIVSHKRRQIGHIFIWLFFIILRRTISSRSYETPCIYRSLASIHLKKHDFRAITVKLWQEIALRQLWKSHSSIFMIWPVKRNYYYEFCLDCHKYIILNCIVSLINKTTFNVLRN